jgi:2-methylcitrate dehydratase PrpD
MSPTIELQKRRVKMEMTERLATFVEETRFETLPAEVVTAAKRAILDTLGVTIAGVEEKGSRILLSSLAPGTGADAVTVFGTSLRTTPPEAALANGTLGHALDFDDVNVSMRGHPSIPVVAAVLALGEQVGSSGRDALTGFVLGFEVECKLGRAVGPSSYFRGWHATSVLGAMGATAACARLLGLDVERTRNAFGIAASMASGSRQNFGTMTKPLHAGLAGRAGVEAAGLASRGFTADREIVEAPLGFGALFSPSGDWQPDRLGDLGKPWDLVQPGIHVKKYPCCHMTHRALDATLSVTGGQPHAASEIDRIEVRVPAGLTSALIHPRPTTGLEGKFSMEYCVAAAILDGGVGLRSFEDVEVRRPSAQELLRKVRVIDVPWSGSGSLPPVCVSVRLRDGRLWEAEVTRERGDPQDPLSWEELVEKYRDCASRVLPEAQVDRSIELLARFEEISVRDLAQTLRLAGRADPTIRQRGAEW